jgi:hypothetical protein
VEHLVILITYKINFILHLPNLADDPCKLLVPFVSACLYPLVPLYRRLDDENLCSCLRLVLACEFLFFEIPGPAIFPRATAIGIPVLVRYKFIVRARTLRARVPVNRIIVSVPIITGTALLEIRAGIIIFLARILTLIIIDVILIFHWRCMVETIRSFD